MSHPARGPDRRSGIDGKSSGSGGRREIVVASRAQNEAVP